MSSSTTSLPAHRSVSSIRPTPSVTAGAPGSPHTPLRTVSSTFGSPSALRAEEDCVVLEIGARYLRVGFAGDAAPKAVLNFGPEEHRRAGDYRRWEVEYETTRRGHTAQKSWGERHELWRPDLRGLELGLVGDKIERALREAYTKYLLLDSRPRRMLLALPTALPLPLLSIILDCLFNNFQPPNISLMSAPVLTTAAAGLRSALVVDIGWAETVVTAVYEYREVSCKRTIRGIKMLGEAFFHLIAENLGAQNALREPQTSLSSEELATLPSFEECEDIVERVAWCKPGSPGLTQQRGRELTPVNEEDELRSSMMSLDMLSGSGPEAKVSMPLSSVKHPRSLYIPFSELSEPCEKALFAKDQDLRTLDDEELPIHILIYRSLLQLPVDARSLCMSRIILVGGGSKLPGLKTRILNEVSQLIDEKDWDIVQGKSYDEYRHNQSNRRTKTNHTGPVEISEKGEIASDSSSAQTTSSAHAKQERDPIEEVLKRDAKKRSKPVESGNLRIVESLGAWAGGSLLAQLKIPAVSVVDKDQWLQNGAAGASRGGETSGSSRQSLGPTFKAGGTERNSWTLGLWG